MSSHEHSSFIPSIIRESYQSLTRNALISTAAILSIIAALLILGIFIIFSMNVRSLTSAAEGDLNIQVFLKEGITQEQKAGLEKAFQENENVAKVDYESKAQALANFSDRLNDYSELLSEYNDTNNPLPESFIIQATSIDKIPELKEMTDQYTDVIEYVRYQENFVDSLKRFTNFINIFSIVLMIIMSLIALFLIYNTIRLTVVNRKKELEIMKYIGATDNFIQLPLMLEGIALGLISAILAALLVCMLYFYFIGYLNGSVLFSFDETLSAPSSVLMIVTLSFIAYGIFIGSTGAAIATRKFLDV